MTKVQSPNFKYISSRCYTLKLKLWNTPTKIVVCANKVEPEIEYVVIKTKHPEIDMFQIHDEETLKAFYKLFGIRYNNYRSSKLDIRMQFLGHITNPKSKLVFNESIIYNCYKPNKDVIIRNKTTHYGIWNEEYETLFLIIERQMFKDGKKIARSTGCLIAKQDTIVTLWNVI